MPALRLLHDFLAHTAVVTPDAIACVAGGRSWRYAELDDAALRLARRLQDAGVARGDRVVIFAENGWPAIVSIYGTLRAGGAFVVVNPQTKADKLAYVLRDSGARALVASAMLAPVFVPAVGASPQLTCVLVAGLPEAGGLPELPQAQSFERVLVEMPAAPSESGVIPIDLAAIIYTSGTTGEPNGVMMSHQAMAFLSGSLLEYLGLTSADRILNVLPLAFGYGLYQLLCSVRVGASVVLGQSFAFPGQVLEAIRAEQATVFPGVPTMFKTIVGAHERAPLAFPSVRIVTNAAAALSPALFPALQTIFPNARLFPMYGLTECQRVCYLDPSLLAHKPGSVGKAIPGTEAFLRTVDGGPVATGQRGVLHVRGPHVMMGYWNRPEETARMLLPGPYPGERTLCTHDWFKTDDEGYLTFLGRSDDIIKTRGEKVSPVDVENCLHGIPGVREAAVVGIADEALGEAVCAYVALVDDSRLTEREIKRHCLARLESFLVPKEVRFVAELPKTSSGKIRKKGIAELAWERRDA